MAGPDIFVSYKSEERGRVQLLVAALRALRLVVFWDADIDAGDNWRQVLETNLASASVVIVVWSREAVGSEFVHDEADRGQGRQVLI